MPDASMVNIAYILRETGFDRAVLNRYLDQDPIRQWLGGAETHPLYPLDNMPRFRTLLANYHRGIKPVSLAAILRSPDMGKGKAELKKRITELESENELLRGTIADIISIAQSVAG